MQARFPGLHLYCCSSFVNHCWFSTLCCSASAGYANVSAVSVENSSFHLYPATNAASSVCALSLCALSICALSLCVLSLCSLCGPSVFSLCALCHCCSSVEPLSVFSTSAVQTFSCVVCPLTRVISLLAGHSFFPQPGGPLLLVIVSSPAFLLYKRFLHTRVPNLDTDCISMRDCCTYHYLSLIPIVSLCSLCPLSFHCHPLLFITQSFFALLACHIISGCFVFRHTQVMIMITHRLSANHRRLHRLSHFYILLSLFLCRTLSLNLCVHFLCSLRLFSPHSLLRSTRC